ncbi:MAG: hypothetical protein AB7R77_11980 [Ilumatobacteraceae bacterium]
MILAIDLNPVDDVIDGVGDLLGGAAEAAGEAVLDVVVKFVFGLIANAVTSITSSIVTAMNATTGVDLDGGFFPALTPIRRTVLGMSMALVLALFFLAILRSLAAGEPGAIIRAVLVDVPVALFTTVASVSVAWVLIRVVDQASLAVTGDVATAMGRFSAALSTVDMLTGAGLLGIIFGLLFVVGAILVWLQLLVRSAMLYILIVLAPLGFATRAHPTTRPIARRTIEMGVALILSKFAVAVAFGVGAAAIDSSNGVATSEGVDLTGMMTGVAVMLMAAFMPWVIWKAIPVVEAAAVTAGVERSPGRAATTAASLGVAVGVGASRLAGGGGAAGGTGGAGVASVDGMPSGSGAATSVAAAGATPGSGRSAAPSNPAAGGGRGGGVSTVEGGPPVTVIAAPPSSPDVDRSSSENGGGR